MRQAPDDRARDACAGPTEVRQPRTKGSLRGPRIGLLSPEHLAITRHSRGNNTFGRLICGLVDMLRHDFGAYAWRGRILARAEAKFRGHLIITIAVPN